MNCNFERRQHSVCMGLFSKSASSVYFVAYLMFLLRATAKGARLVRLPPGLSCETRRKPPRGKVEEVERNRRGTGTEPQRNQNGTAEHPPHGKSKETKRKSMCFSAQGPGPGPTLGPLGPALGSIMSHTWSFWMYWIFCILLKIWNF